MNNDRGDVIPDKADDVLTMPEYIRQLQNTAKAICVETQHKLFEICNPYILSYFFNLLEYTMCLNIPFTVMNIHRVHGVECYFTALKEMSRLHRF